MSVALWLVSGLLAVAFIVSGVAKATMSRDRLLATGQTGIAPFPMPVVRIVACCELLAVVGLFAPWLTGVVPALTPVAALGLVAVMSGAAVSHASLGEPRPVAVNLALLLAAGFVAAGRFAQLL
ncbi:MAG: DoxX family protein [Streptosporangiales bacterium]|nr:DoxX family protein [Streptosporangiales bacterium]